MTAAAGSRRFGFPRALVNIPGSWLALAVVAFAIEISIRVLIERSD